MSTLVPSVYDKLAFNIISLLCEDNLSEYDIEKELLSIYSLSSENVRDLLNQMEKLKIIYLNEDNHWSLTNESLKLIDNNDDRLPTLLSSFQFGEISFTFNQPEDELETVEDQNQDLLIRLKAETEDKIDEYYTSLRVRIRELLLTSNPFRLEEIAIELLVKSGEGKYGVGTPKTHDGGIDGYVYETLLERGGMPIQTKQHAEHRYVTAEEIHGFLSVCRSKGANTGYYVTTSYFSDTAKTTSRLELCLIDGEQLVNLVLKTKVGLIAERGYLPSIAEDYFLRPPLPSGKKFEVFS
jgi:restriction system protein